MDKVIRSIGAITHSIRKNASKVSATVGEISKTLQSFMWMPTRGESFTEVEWVPEMTFKCSGGVEYESIGLTEINMSLFEEGVKAAVYIDGSRYEFTARYYDETVVILGNIALISGMATSIPPAPNNFLILFDAYEASAMMILMADDGEHTFAINYVVSGDNKLPEMLLPDIVSTKDYAEEQAMNVVESGLRLFEGEIKMPKSAAWKSMAYGKEMVVAVSNNSDIAYSRDGLVWELAITPGQEIYRPTFESVTYGNGKFVAVASNDGKAYHSSDGIVWSHEKPLGPSSYGAAKIIPGLKTWQCICCANGKFVVLASGTDKGAYSYDGMHWNEMQMTTVASWKAITYGRGSFVAVALDGSCAYSLDGVRWRSLGGYNYSGEQIVSTVGYRSKVYAIANNSNKLFVVPYSGASLSDQLVASALPYSSGWACLAAGESAMVAVSNEGKVATINVGTSWGDVDGNWTDVTMPVTAAWNSVAYCGGRFIAVAKDSDVVAYSEDGYNWICEYNGFIHHNRLAPDVVSKKYIDEVLAANSGTLPNAAEVQF